MLNAPLIPIPGLYSAWFVSTVDDEPFALPILGFEPEQVYYGTGPDEQPSTELEPVVLSYSGSLVQLADNHVMPLCGGAFIGVTPASWDEVDALTFLSGRYVVDGPNGTTDRVTAARRKARARRTRQAVTT